jgi:VWFA-related protein
MVLCLGSASSQEIARPPSNSRTLLLNVVVTPKSGETVRGLQKSDFVITDNTSPATISSFKEVTPAEEPVNISLVIDAVNTNFSRVAYATEQVQKFLRASGGHLSQPTTLAVLTDKGMEMEKTFTSDGNALSASLDQHTIGLRQITRSSGIWGADERVQISLTAVQQLTAYSGTIPGRKIVLWVSPGWPLLSGERIQLSSRQQQQIFGNVVSFSRQLQMANVTMYNINPLGPAENLFRADYYQSFINGVSKPSQTDLADLSLQVLAIQSGGVAFTSSNDVSGNLTKSLLDATSWYEITLDIPNSEKANEYHHLEVKVNKSGVTARTRDGYYAQP